MADAQSQADNFEDLLTCTICLEKFKIPKYLPCLHTFCESCINTYILSTMKKESEQSAFNCPVCRKRVVSENIKGMPETWAEQLPGNHFVTSMIDRTDIQKSEKMCDSCSLNNKTEKAISWCIVCEEAFCRLCETCHKTFKISSKHRIIPLKEVALEKSNLESFVHCEEHCGELINVYCVDDDKPLCTLCATLSHRKCDNVITIEKAANGVKASGKTLGLISDLKEVSKNIDALIQNRKENLSNFEEDANAGHAKITAVKKTVIDHVNKLADQLQDQLETTKKQVGLKASDETTELSSYKSVIENWIKIIETCIQHGSDQQCLVEINKITNQTAKLNDELHNCISKMKALNVDFNWNEMISDFTSRIKSFGNITTNESDIHIATTLPKVKADFQNGKIQVLQTIALGTEGKKSGIFLNNELILTVNDGYKIFKYGLDGVYQSKLEVDYKPFDICKVTNSTVAVSSGTANILVVNAQAMVVLQTITTSVNTNGLSYVNGELLNANGNTLTWINAVSGVSVETKMTNENTWFVFASSRQDYVYADGTKMVKSVVNGATKFTYTNAILSYPRGIDRDSQGNLYICGPSNIHQIASDGNLIRIIKASECGIISPWVIRFESNNNRFLITCWESEKVAICEII